MATEIDPLILELRVNNARFRADLKNTSALAAASLGRMERNAKSLETQFQRSSGAISGSLKGMAGALAGAFSVQQIGAMVDNFTRLQNALRVAGLEGAGLADVQGKLLDLSSKYGVSVNELANLYGKSTQAASDLGASEAQLLQITEASAQALRITGTSAVQAQGALLGLTQALASGTVRAEEFNQINEGGLRPLLQVAAANEKYGGSVAKLRQAVVDGKVSSQEFYNAILAGSAALDSQASKAALTLAGAFEALSSRLTVYIGEASAANGVTSALANGIALLADNLDTIIPALAIIAATMAGGYAVSLGIAATRSAGLALASLGLAASLNGTAAAATLLGRALLGPVGLAITGVSLALGYLATQTDNATQAAQEAASQAQRTSTALDIERKVTDQLTSAKGRERAATLASIQASRARAAQAIQTARALVQEAKASLAAERVKLKRAENLGRIGDVESGAGGIPSLDGGAAKRNANASPIGIRVREFEKNIGIAEKGIADAEAFVAAIDKGISAANAPVKLAGTGVSAGKGAKGGGRSGGAGPTGPTAEETLERFNAQLISIAQQTLSTQASMATTADERAEFELRALELTRKQSLAQIENDKEYTAAQKERLNQEVETQVFEEKARIEKARLAQITQESADIAQAQNDVLVESLRGQYDLADSQAERRDLALRIIDAEFDLLESKQQEIINAEASNEYQKERARLELARLQAERGGQVEGAKQQTAGPLESYINNASLNANEMNEALQGVAVDGLDALNNGLTDAIMNSKDLGSVFKNVAKSIIADLIRIAIQQLIVNTLMSAIGGGIFGGLFGGGGGGGFASSVTSTAGRAFGRASGGHVNAGSVYRVNESNKEYFQPNNSGNIIPLSKMNAAIAGGGNAGGGMVTLRVEMTEDLNARIQSQSAQVAVEVVRTAAPSIRDAAVSETFRRGSRPGFRK